MNPITGGTSLGDVLTLALAVVWVLVPGAVVLLAAGVRRVPLLLGAAPATSIGISTVAASVTGLSGTGFTWWWVVITAAVLAGLSALVRGRHREPFETERFPRGPSIAAGVLLLAAASTTFELFRRGMGALATPSQEHDTITHTLVVARILRSGHAEPWRGQALDVVTGDPTQYYPNGLHQWAALTAQTSGVDAVSGLNATSVVVLAVVQTLGLLALASKVLPRTWLTAGGVAAIASVLAYQPLQAMHHDSGALPNAAAIAFAPGVIALLLPPERTPGRGVAGLVPAIAMAVVGAVTVHPSAALTIAGGFLGAHVFGSLCGWRNPLRWRWFAGLAATAAVVAGIVGSALLQAASTGGGSSSRFERDIDVELFGDALHRVFTLPLQGGIDPQDTRSQWWLAIAVLAGFVLAGRKAGAAALTWLIWSAIAVAYLVGVQAPVLDLVWDSAWNSYYRVVAHGSPWAWLLAGVAVARIAESFARRAEPLVAAALGAVLLAGAATEIAPTEVTALRERYADPTYFRISTDDQAAAQYLADHVGPGERVLNSGNDGSTYAYVLEGVPIMATTAVPTTPVPDLRTLSKSLRDMTPQVRELIEEYDITYVVVDSLAPGLPLRPADVEFFGVPGYAVPPGLTDLDAVPDLQRVFTSGSVGVWRIDRS